MVALAATLAGFVGKHRTVLVEQVAVARTPEFIEAMLDRPLSVGTIAHAEITGVAGRRLTARLVADGEVRP